MGAEGFPMGSPVTDIPIFIRVALKTMFSKFFHFINYQQACDTHAHTAHIYVESTHIHALMNVLDPNLYLYTLVVVYVSIPICPILDYHY